MLLKPVEFVNYTEFDKNFYKVDYSSFYGNKIYWFSKLYVRFDSHARKDSGNIQSVEKSPYTFSSTIF